MKAICQRLKYMPKGYQACDCGFLDCYRRGLLVAEVLKIVGAALVLPVVLPWHRFLCWLFGPIESTGARTMLERLRRDDES